MANTVIKLKKSSVASHLPTAGQLEHGEIALNYADGKIFYKDPANNIQQISGSANTFYTVNAGGTLLVSTSPTDILTINPGNNIEITGDFLTDTLTIAANLKSVFDTANAAFASANNVSPQIAPARDTANAAYDTANAAFAAANNVSPQIAPTRDLLNVAFGVANASYVSVNAAYTVANAAFAKANLAASAATINIGNAPPTGVNPGALWWDTISGRMFIYYTDDDSTQWVETSPAGGGEGRGVTGVANVSANPPSSPTNGSFWWNSDLGKLYIYYTDNDSAQWVEAVPTVVGLEPEKAFANGSAAITIGDSALYSANIVTSTATDQILDRFPTTSYRSASYSVTMNAGTSYHTTQLSVLHDDTNAYISEYGTITTGGSLATFSISIISSNVALNVTPVNATTTVRLLRTTNK